MDNAGVCRFHRLWAEEMLPQVFEEVYKKGELYKQLISVAASRINSRNASVFWESEQNIQFVHSFLERQISVEGSKDPELLSWAEAFRQNPHEAALNYWFEVRKGIDESLRDFF